MKIRNLERFLLLIALLIAFNANAGGICAITQTVNGCNDIPIISSPIISIPVQGGITQEPITLNPITITPVASTLSFTLFSEGVYHYNFEYNPASNELANQFVVPYFSDAQISNIQMPTDWVSSFVKGSLVSDPKWGISNVGKMKWTYIGSTPLTIESPWIGFTFDSPFAPTSASLVVTDVGGNVVANHNSIQTPLSRLAIQAGLTALPSLVSEPETLLMLVAGLGVMNFAARRKQA